jgi:glutathione-regulated potassium-efflux system ancillary protein KefF
MVWCVHCSNQARILHAQCGMTAPPLTLDRSTTTPEVLVLTAHPNLHLSHVNRPLMQAAQRLPHVNVRDLYALYPDYVIDVAAEQAALASAQLIVWQHPLHWYSMPALMKLWLDEVLTHGWAYGHTPEGAPAQRLQGKDLWLVVSTGGTQAAYRPQGYNRHAFEAFMPPYAQTAALCGMRFLPPLVLHGAQQVSAEALDAHQRRYTTLLSQYPHWPDMQTLADCPSCSVPPDDRPTPSH